MHVENICCLAGLIKFALFFGTVQQFSLALPQLGTEISGHNFDRIHRSSNRPCSGCKNIEKNSKEYRLYLEYIKADILSKLGMTERPKKTAKTTQMPAPVSEGRLPRVDEIDDSDEKLSNQVIIIGEKG